MDSEGPYRFAGYGETGHLRFPLADNGITKISYENHSFKTGICGGYFFGDDDENMELFGRVAVEGDFMQTAVFDSGVLLFPRDGILKAVANSYSHKAKFGKNEKEFWTDMLLNYLKRRSFDFKSSWWHPDEKFDYVAKHTYDSGVKNAVESAKTLRRIMKVTDGHKYVVSLSSIDPFRLAKPKHVEIDGEFDFSADCYGHDKIQKSGAKGRLVLTPRKTKRYSLFSVPCSVSSGYFETPNISNDIARTDGVRKSEPAILRGRGAEVYIEDVGRAYDVLSLKDLMKELKGSYWEIPAITGLCGAAGAVAGAVGGFTVAATYAALADISDFWSITLAGSKYGASIWGGLFGVAGCLASVSGTVEGVGRKIIGNPSMKYLVRASEP